MQLIVVKQSCPSWKFSSDKIESEHNKGRKTKFLVLKFVINFDEKWMEYYQNM